MIERISNSYQVLVTVPVADAFAGTLNTDIVNVQGHGVKFTIGKGAGATGTSTITVSACDDTTPSNTTDVIFWYRAMTTLGTWGAWTAATATGFTTTAGANQMYEVYAPGDVLGATGYGYARLNAVEVANDPVTGYVVAEVINTRYSTQSSTLLT